LALRFVEEEERRRKKKKEERKKNRRRRKKIEEILHELNDRNGSEKRKRCLKKKH